MADLGQHAVVIGGSIGGLLAARVLRDHFERVTVIDRDKFPLEPAYRKGVPQSRHVHALLARGQLVLESLFPGLAAELGQEGAVTLETPLDILALTPAGWAQRYRSGLNVLSCSRELLEFHVRGRLRLSPVVSFLEETEVTDLVAGADLMSIAGVRLRHRNAPEGPDDEIRADLVVDASGRDSRAPQWLTAIGYESPEETKITPFTGYASRYYEPATGFVADWKVLFLLPSPGSTRGGVLFPIEGGRWMVTLMGMARDYPPTDEAGFLEFARSLRSPILHNVIRAARPLSSIHGYRRTENQRRHYERLQRWPRGFIVLGDAACAFNPIYGQGMSVCALEAMELERCLTERRSDGLGGFGPRFQRRLARTSGAVWLLATSADLRYPTTEGGRRGTLSRLVRGYTERMQVVATQDPVVASAFRHVTQLLKPPSSLFAPGIVLRVLAPRKIRMVDRPPTDTPFDSPPALAYADVPQAT
jgi:2-polyprenyl-6-methoxyphenol hydroxylase-like FAD-dependent oxidoreductase